jgi:hypothetical protein
VDEHVARIANQARQRVEVAGEGQRDQVDDLDPGADRLEHEIAADEPGAAGD